MSSTSDRESVIRVALRIFNEDGWSTEYGKTTSGFVLTKNGERMLVVGHGRWNLDADEREQLYGKLLKLCTKHPDSSRGAVILPVSARAYVNEVGADVRNALGVDIAIVDPARSTLKWLHSSTTPDYVDLDGSGPRPTRKGGVLSRLRRLF